MEQINISSGSFSRSDFTQIEPAKKDRKQRETKPKKERTASQVERDRKRMAELREIKAARKAAGKAKGEPFLESQASTI